MTHDDVARWLDAYVEAWRTYDPERIGALFADDAEYRYRPSDEPVRGRPAIVDAWLAEPDVAGTYDAAYRPWALDGSRAVALGVTRYTGADGDRAYDNAFLLEFDADGRCASFTELYVEVR